MSFEIEEVFLTQNSTFKTHNCERSELAPLALFRRSSVSDAGVSHNVEMEANR